MQLHLFPLHSQGRLHGVMGTSAQQNLQHKPLRLVDDADQLRLICIEA